jgi:hypothetical protein
MGLLWSSNRECVPFVGEAGAVVTEGLLLDFTNHTTITPRATKHDAMGGGPKFRPFAKQRFFAIRHSRRAEQIILRGGQCRVRSGLELTKVDVESTAGEPGADAARQRVNVEAIASRNRSTGIHLAIDDERVAAL